MGLRISALRPVGDCPDVSATPRWRASCPECHFSGLKSGRLRNGDSAKGFRKYRWKEFVPQSRLTVGVYWNIQFASWRAGWFETIYFTVRFAEAFLALDESYYFRCGNSFYSFVFVLTVRRDWVMFYRCGRVYVAAGISKNSRRMLRWNIFVLCVFCKRCIFKTDVICIPFEFSDFNIRVLYSRSIFGCIVFWKHLLPFRLVQMYKKIAIHSFWFVLLNFVRFKSKHF